MPTRSVRKKASKLQKKYKVIVPVALIAVGFIASIYIALAVNTKSQDTRTKAASLSADFSTIDLQPVDTLYTAPGERRTVVYKTYSSAISAPFPEVTYGLEQVNGEMVALVGPKVGLPTVIELFVPENAQPGRYTLTVSGKQLAIEVVNIPRFSVEATFGTNKSYNDQMVSIDAWLATRKLGVYSPTPSTGLWLANPFNKWDNGPVYNANQIAAAKALRSFHFLTYGAYFYQTNPNTVNVNGKTQDQMSLAELTSHLRQAKEKLRTYGLDTGYIFVDEPPHAVRYGWTQEIEDRVTKMARAAVNAGFEVRVATPGPSQHRFWKDKFPKEVKYYMTANRDDVAIAPDQSVSMYYNLSGLDEGQLASPSPSPSTWASVGQIMWKRHATKYLEWALAYWKNATPDIVREMVWSRTLQKNDLFLPNRPSDGKRAIPTVQMVALTEGFQDLGWLKKTEADYGNATASALSNESNTNTMRRKIFERMSGGRTHLACQNQQCMSVSGVGSNECAVNADCSSPVTHLECRNQQCARVNGAGDNKCTTDAQCQAPPTALGTIHRSTSAYLDGDLQEYGTGSPLATFGDTEVRAVWKPGQLYLGFTVANDTDLVATQTKELCEQKAESECSVWSDDSIEWFIDMRGDGGGAANRNASYMRSDDYQGILNRNRARIDTRGSDSTNKPSFDWNGNWKIVVVQKENGFVMEMRIPLEELEGAPQDYNNYTFGLGFARNDRDEAGATHTMWNSTAKSFQNASNWTQVKLAD